MFALLFGIISLLYATVGQAGGTAFLALMAFAAFPSTEMRPTALALNIVITVLFDDLRIVHAFPKRIVNGWNVGAESVRAPVRIGVLTGAFLFTLSVYYTPYRNTIGNRLFFR